MSIQTEFGGVGKVRTELEKERTKLSIDPIKIILVDHGGRANQAWIAIQTAGSNYFGGAKGAGLLVRFADQHDPFLTCRLFDVGRHHIIFALSLLKPQHRYLMELGITLDR